MKGETGVKELDQGIIIVIMATHNQDFNLRVGYKGSKNVSKELIQQCSVGINYMPGTGDTMVGKLDIVPVTMKLQIIG